MNLPKIIADLVEAQNNYESVANTNCFSKTAVVFDEGNTYKDRIEIQNWIVNANEKYKTVKKPLEYKVFNTEGILTAEISGTFDGSPVFLTYYFEIVDGLIQSLKITV